MSNRGEIMSNSERNILSHWANVIFPKMKKLTNNRYNYTLFTYDKDILPLVWEIKSRIMEREELNGYIQEPILKDFLAIMPEGSFIHKHRDPTNLDSLHCRFNVFLQLPDLGGITYYDNKIIDAKEGCYVLSRSCIDTHWSTPIEGNKSRISLSFGFLVSSEKLETLSSKFCI
jgi:hypothetical protein